MTSITTLAPCKLNLFLHITGRRDDGYHLLQSLFLLLAYGDTLTITRREDGELRLLQPLAGVLPAQDLCIRAARALQQATGCRLGADILCEKRTPLGGGLGGGSSDAASVLMALNQLWQLGLTREALMQIGVSLGADVPVFIFGQTAWAEGIGEQLIAWPWQQAVLARYYVVLTPALAVPTAQIFAQQALTRDSKPLRIADFSNGAFASEFWQNTRNDLQAVVCTLYPAVAQLIDWASQFGPARMSGSGASVFVVVDSARQAEEILSQRPENTSGFWAKGLEYHPLFSTLAS